MFYPLLLAISNITKSVAKPTELIRGQYVLRHKELNDLRVHETFKYFADIRQN